MTQQSKKHLYPYSLRLCMMSGVTMCQDKALLYIVPPAQALTIENLYCHFKMTFDTGVASADRVLKYIGVANEVPLLVTSPDPSYLRKIDLNQLADINRVVEARLDLSQLLDRDSAGYREFNDSVVGDNLTYVIIKLADGCQGNNNVGVINKWKLDALFTTTGIR